MKAILSSTFEDNYLFSLPIVIWCWNKLNVDTITFFPVPRSAESTTKWVQVAEAMRSVSDGRFINDFRYFSAPPHKEATYAQCSRLFGACLDLPEDEILITSDADMCVFNGINGFLNLVVDGIQEITTSNVLSILGADLTPKGQYPMCFARANVRAWRGFMEINGETYQKCLDRLLGDIEAEHFRGNYWGKDQETLFNQGKNTAKIEVARARPGTQFANNRVDRDDINWRHYVNESLVDAHLWRPGYTEENFKNILELLQMMYPMDNFDWLIEYRNNYVNLL
jgi:hypothetical protein